MRDLTVLDHAELGHVTGGDSPRSHLARATLRGVFEGASMIGRSEYRRTFWPGVYSVTGKFMANGEAHSYTGFVNKLAGHWQADLTTGFGYMFGRAPK